METTFPQSTVQAAESPSDADSLSERHLAGSEMLVLDQTVSARKDNSNHAQRHHPAKPGQKNREPVQDQVAPQG
jgi:hypothetical protein|tara:strand:+ start:286 stop:507 length:222 start_codon:yes stop_codon:yes gene_type:complete